MNTATRNDKLKHILVVDDSSTEREHLTMILNMAGHRVSTAESGTSALTAIESELPDLVLLDIVMADMDGFRTCREIKRNPESAKVPVVMVSSKNNKADHVWAEEQGADGYIVKPFAESELLDTVARF